MDGNNKQCDRVAALSSRKCSDLSALCGLEVPENMVFVRHWVMQSFCSISLHLHVRVSVGTVHCYYV